jgi:hypothetical protein
VVFEWVDGAGTHWEPAFAAVWRARLADMRMSPKARLRWQPMRLDDVLRLRDIYHAGYLISQVQAPPLPFPVALQGRCYRLQRLR